MISKWAAKVGLAAVMLGAVTAAGADTPQLMRAFGWVYMRDASGRQYSCVAYGLYEPSAAGIYVAMYAGSTPVLYVNKGGVVPSWSGSGTPVVFSAPGTWYGSQVTVQVTFKPNSNNLLQGDISITVSNSNGVIATLNRVSGVGYMIVAAR